MKAGPPPSLVEGDHSLVPNIILPPPHVADVAFGSIVAASVGGKRKRDLTACTSNLVDPCLAPSMAPTANPSALGSSEPSSAKVVTSFMVKSNDELGHCRLPHLLNTNGVPSARSMQGILDWCPKDQLHAFKRRSDKANHNLALRNAAEQAVSGVQQWLYISNLTDQLEAAGAQAKEVNDKLNGVQLELAKEAREKELIAEKLKAAHEELKEAARMNASLEYRLEELEANKDRKARMVEIEADRDQLITEVREFEANRLMKLVHKAVYKVVGEEKGPALKDAIDAWIVEFERVKSDKEDVVDEKGVSEGGAGGDEGDGDGAKVDDGEAVQEEDVQSPSHG